MLFTLFHINNISCLLNTCISTWSELIVGYVASKNVYLGEGCQTKRYMNLVLKRIALGLVKKSMLCHLHTMGLWADYSLSLNSFMHKTNIISVSQGRCEY